MDYKYVAGADALTFSSPRRRKPITFKIALISGVVLLTGFLFTQQYYKKKNTSVVPSILSAEKLPAANPNVWRWTPFADPVVPASLSMLPLLQKAVTARWETVTIRKGDTLLKIFNRLGVKTDIAKPKSGLKQATKKIASLKANTPIKILIDENKGVQQLAYALNDLETLHVTRKGNAYLSNVERQKTETKLAYFGTSLDHSLARTAQKNGLDKTLVTQLASIFKDKINVAQLRKGDYFNMLYQEEYLGKKKVRTGSIVAAQIVNKGAAHRAVRYADARGRVDYYTPEGKSLKIGFTRIPLQNYKKVSSHFSNNRFHPTLRRNRPHHAVDFSAAMGTPIKAASAGQVAYVGYKGAYGKMVEIKHPGQVATLYAHMSRFNSGIKSGSRVQEGQVIGFVGATGRTTGPHLHYEIKMAGIKRNPLTVALPAAASLDKAARAKFLPLARRLMAQLDMGKSVKLASTASTTLNKPKPKDA